MKRISKEVYTIAHNLILIDKSYEFISLFVKGNDNILNGSQINKIHVFMSIGKSAYRILDTLNDIAKNSKVKVIVHASSDFVSKVMNTFLSNNEKGKGVKFVFINNKQVQEFTDDSGTLTVHPYNFMKTKSGSHEYKVISHCTKKGDKKKNGKMDNK